MSNKRLMNHARADWALEALNRFGEVTGQGTDPDEINTTVKDLLCDLMHYCGLTGVPFEDILEDAREDYRDEVATESNMYEDGTEKEV